jgi:hypothetical protein
MELRFKYTFEFNFVHYDNMHCCSTGVKQAIYILKKNKELQEKKFSWDNFHVIFSLEQYIWSIL